MTLILTCLTHDFIVQISDRRLGDLVTGIPKDDDANKVVAYWNIAAFSYTGLSYVSKTQTDHWIVDQLAPLADPSQFTPYDLGAKLAASATTEFQKGWMSKLSKSYKRHAFVCGAWVTLPTNQVRPMIMRVSNFHDRKGNKLSEPSYIFSRSIRILDPFVPVYLEVTGQDQAIDDDLKKETENQIRACVKKGTSPEPIARILRILMRKVATKNTAVGKNLLEMSLPIKAYSANEMSYSSFQHNRETATFHYVPENTNTGIMYSPLMLSSAMQMLGMTVTYTPPK
jgi:hypothetical protein